eukprot:4148075-Pyramimonas_sp.AAC.1
MPTTTAPTLATSTLTVPTKPPWKATRPHRLCTLCAGAPQVAEVRAPGHVAVLRPLGCSRSP